MKKIVYVILSFVFLLLGGNIISDFFATAEETEITIGSAQEFVTKFTTNSEIYNPNVVVRLTDDLDFNGVDISQINSNKSAFKGVFDGKGFSISNLNISSSNLYYGLIPYANGATIQNVRIAGDVEFLFNSQITQEIYAGILVGYGENVVIKNCELDNMIIDADDETIVTYDSITIPVKSNINFGLLAGKLKGNPNGANLIEPANIYNCINYYDVNVIVEEFADITVGGLVGQLDNCYMQNCLNWGSITYSKDETLANSTSSNLQYLGGIAGTISGQYLNIRNNCFGGTVDSVSGSNSYYGALIGAAVSSGVNPLNINFAYYTQQLKPSGDDFVEIGAKIKTVEKIDKNLLLNQDNFDVSIKPWDFEKTWILSGSRYHIQNFQWFNFEFGSVLDQVLENPTICLPGNQTENNFISVKYGSKIEIKLFIKNEYQGFYYLNENKDILLNGNQYNGEYEISSILNEEGEIAGYVILVEANATTMGAYSFTMSPKTYECEISISEEAKSGAQGGVRVQNKNSNTQTSPSSEFSLTFAYNSEEKSVIAEGKDIYSFDHWQLYYRDENGEFSGEPVSFSQESSPLITIAFGAAPFNKEFRLVAFFTDEEAIKVGFGNIDLTKIKSMSIAGTKYLGEPIQIAPTRIVQVEITTLKDYVINSDALSEWILSLYGYTPSPYPAVSKEKETSSEGETTYYFQIDLNYVKENIQNNEILIEVNTSQDKTNDSNALIWILVAVGVLLIIAVSVIIFFVVRRKKGGVKVRYKEKKKSYKDYYM